MENNGQAGAAVVGTALRLDWRLTNRLTTPLIFRITIFLLLVLFFAGCTSGSANRCTIVCIRTSTTGCSDGRGLYCEILERWTECTADDWYLAYKDSYKEKSHLRKLLSGMPAEDLVSLTTYVHSTRCPSGGYFNEMLDECLVEYFLSSPNAEMLIKIFADDYFDQINGVYLEWAIERSGQNAVGILSRSFILNHESRSRNRMLAAFARAFPNISLHPDRGEEFIAECSDYFKSNCLDLTINVKYQQPVQSGTTFIKSDESDIPGLVQNSNVTEVGLFVKIPATSSSSRGNR
jgi:hypothetical protein